MRKDLLPQDQVKYLSKSILILKGTVDVVFSHISDFQWYPLNLWLTKNEENLDVVKKEFSITDEEIYFILFS